MVQLALISIFLTMLIQNHVFCFSNSPTPTSDPQGNNTLTLQNNPTSAANSTTATGIIPTQVNTPLTNQGNSSITPSANITNSSISASEWKNGTFTFFGGPLDAQSDASLENNVPNCINLGSVSRELFIREKPAAFYAAVSDSMPEFEGPLCTKKNPNDNDEIPSCANQGSCGKCFEVRCVAKLDRQQNDAATEAAATCTQGTSVVVRVIDACPHNHPINEGKGDKNPCKLGGPPHMDLGHKAFEAIALAKVGIIYGQYRRVDCNEGLGQKNNGLLSFDS